MILGKILGRESNCLNVPQERVVFQKKTGVTEKNSEGVVEEWRGNCVIRNYSPPPFLLCHSLVMHYE